MVNKITPPGYINDINLLQQTETELDAAKVDYFNGELQKVSPTKKTRVAIPQDVDTIKEMFEVIKKNPENSFNITLVLDNVDKDYIPLVLNLVEYIGQLKANSAEFDISSITLITGDSKGNPMILLPPTVIDKEALGIVTERIMNTKLQPVDTEKLYVEINKSHKHPVYTPLQFIVTLTHETNKYADRRISEESNKLVSSGFGLVYDDKFAETLSDPATFSDDVNFKTTVFITSNIYQMFEKYIQLSKERGTLQSAIDNLKKWADDSESFFIKLAAAKAIYPQYDELDLIEEIQMGISNDNYPIPFGERQIGPDLTNYSGYVRNTTGELFDTKGRIIPDSAIMSFTYLRELSTIKSLRKLGDLLPKHYMPLTEDGDFSKPNTKEKLFTDMCSTNGRLSETHNRLKYHYYLKPLNESEAAYPLHAEKTSFAPLKVLMEHLKITELHAAYLYEGLINSENARMFIINLDDKHLKIDSRGLGVNLDFKSQSIIIEKIVKLTETDVSAALIFWEVFSGDKTIRDSKDIATSISRHLGDNDAAINILQSADSIRFNSEQLIAQAQKDGLVKLQTPLPAVDPYTFVLDLLTSLNDAEKMNALINNEKVKNFFIDKKNMKALTNAFGLSIYRLIEKSGGNVVLPADFKENEKLYYVRASQVAIELIIKYQQIAGYDVFDVMFDTAFQNPINGNQSIWTTIYSQLLLNHLDALLDSRRDQLSKMKGYPCYQGLEETDPLYFALKGSVRLLREVYQRGFDRLNSAQVTGMAGTYLNLKVLGPALFNRLITFSELSGSVDTKNIFGSDARSFKAWGTSSIMGLAPWAQRLSESLQKSN